MSFISIKGAKEHNLKNLDLDIPKNSLVVFTGVSGSGKSSLVFDTIYAEAFRRFVDASQVPIYIMGNSVWSKVTRPHFRSMTGLPPALGLSQKQGVASKISTVGTISGISDLFRVYYAAFGDVYCTHCDIPLKANDFSSLVTRVLTDFEGKKVYFIAILAEKRKGAFAKEIEKFRELGFSKLRVNDKIFDLQEENLIKIDPKKLNTIEVIVDLVLVSNEKKARVERAILQALEYGKGILKIELQLEQETYKFNTTSSCPQCGESAPKLDPRYFSHSSLGQCLTCSGTGSLNEYLPNDLFPCTDCSGSRLTKKRPIVRLFNKTFEQIHNMSLAELKIYFDNTLAVDNNSLAKNKILNELNRLLNSIHNLNLSHLNLNRSGSSLSPGDLQRLRLSSMISNNLTGALYVADEPCQGLTKQEVIQISKVFNNLIKNKSSVITVEHHPTFLEHADLIYLMGPKAGLHGGELISITKNEKNYTAKVSQERSSIPKEKGNAKISFTNISFRNIKINSINLYQGKINILRGPSGTGKSSFIDLNLMPTLYKLGAKNISEDETHNINPETFCKFNVDNQISASIVSYVKPGSMSRASRRNVASALEVIQPIRKLFSQLPLSQVMGLTESHFSWSSKLGRCDNCEGRGYIELPQKYAQPVRVQCEICLGSKLSSRSLAPRFKGYNLADLMNLTLEQVVDILAQHKQIVSKLQRACHFGLGYILLGQGMDSLSGGELQRLNLTLELKRTNLEGAWFVLVHPSTGLHKPDIEILGKLMHEMVSKGATFVAIENREEFLDFAHHIVEFT
jgi:excinuclease ABC subunit A